MQGWAVPLSKDLVVTAHRGRDESSVQLPPKETAALTQVAEHGSAGWLDEYLADSHSWGQDSSWPKVRADFGNSGVTVLPAEVTPC